MADLFQQQIDISGVHNWGIVEHKFLQDLGLNLSDLYSVVCRILEVWQNREASQVHEYWMVWNSGFSGEAYQMV